MKQLTNEEIGALCLGLSHLLHSGIGPADALTLLGTDDPLHGQLLLDMAEKTDSGSTLSQAMRETAVFPGYVCTLTEVGETTGKLEEAMAALSRYYQNRARLTARLRSALVYPAALMLVLLAVMTVLLVWVLPVFDRVYAQLGAGLTGLAGWLLALGMGIKKALPVLLAVGIAVIGMLAVPPVRKGLVKTARKLLGDRGVMGRIYRARFLQALSMAFSSGMTAQAAAETAASLAEDPVFQKRCAKCCGLLEQGSSLARALGETGMLSKAHCRLLEVGSRSGRQEQILAQLAQQLLEESEEALERRAGTAEPAMVVIACVLIGTVLLAVLLPMVQIMSAIG